MIIQTPAIVISSIKYGDTSKIVKCYTKSSGIQSFIAKGVYSKKNKINPLISPLNQIELLLDDKNTKNIQYFKNAGQSVHYTSIHLLPQKTAIALFLSEILNSALQEEEANSGLFDFISSSFENFDKKETSYADFHLWFLINLTKYLGFYPNISSKSLFFDLMNGISTDSSPAESYISGEELTDLKTLISLQFDQSQNQFNQTQRKSLLNILMDYYRLHISDFRQPKSLNVLAVVFE